MNRHRAFAVAATTLLLISCSQPPDRRPAVAVGVETVLSVATPSHTRYTGTVRAERQVEVAFRSGGYVDTIAGVGSSRRTAERRPLQAGDSVHRGMVLATLRQGDYKQRLSEAAAMSREAAAARRHAAADLKRARRLLRTGAISRAEYDATRSRVDVLDGSVVAAAARTGQTRLILRDTELRSPLDGIILDRMVEAGALVSPGTPVFSVADTSTVRVSFMVPDRVQGTLALGRRMVVTTSAVPDQSFSGAISKIAAQADPKSRAFEVEVTVDNPGLILKVGMIASVEAARPLDVGEALAVPLSAVTETVGDSNGFTLYVVREERGATVAHARSVQLAGLVGNRVTISSGVRAGERIVVQGSTLITDGSRVRIIPAHAPSSAEEATAPATPPSAPTVTEL